MIVSTGLSIQQAYQYNRLINPVGTDREYIKRRFRMHSDFKFCEQCHSHLSIYKRKIQIAFRIHILRTVSIFILPVGTDREYIKGRFRMHSDFRFCEQCHSHLYIYKSLYIKGRFRLHLDFRFYAQCQFWFCFCVILRKLPSLSPMQGGDKYGNLKRDIKGMWNKRIKHCRKQ